MYWKVVVNINNFQEQKTLYLKGIDSKENAYLEAKRYFIEKQPEIDFCGVQNATII